MRAERNCFQVKICGVTTVDDAIMAAEAGADAIGLNFWPQSKRRVSVDTARKSSAKLHDVVRVGVFVNATADRSRGLRIRSVSIGFNCMATSRPNCWRSYQVN